MSEELEAKRDGAKLHRNSGRGWVEKGDASLGPFLIDYKESAKSFTLNRRVWGKVQADALRMRLQPVLRIVLGDKPDEKLRLWIVGDAMFRDMLEAYEEKYGQQG